MGKRKSKARKDTEAAVRAMADFVHALESEEFCHALCNEIIWWGNAFNDSLRALQGQERQDEGSSRLPGLPDGVIYADLTPHEGTYPPGKE